MCTYHLYVYVYRSTYVYTLLVYPNMNKTYIYTFIVYVCMYGYMKECRIFVNEVLWKCKLTSVTVESFQHFLSKQQKHFFLTVIKWRLVQRPSEQHFQRYILKWRSITRFQKRSCSYKLVLRFYSQIISSIIYKRRTWRFHPDYSWWKKKQSLEFGLLIFSEREWPFVVYLLYL